MAQNYEQLLLKDMADMRKLYPFPELISTIANLQRKYKKLQELKETSISDEIFDDIVSFYGVKEGESVIKFLKAYKEDQIRRFRINLEDGKFWTIFIDTEDGRKFLSREKPSAGYSFVDSSKDAQLFTAIKADKRWKQLKALGMDWKHATIGWLKRERYSKITNEVVLLTNALRNYWIPNNN